MARGPALVLEVALVEVVAADPLHRRQVVQSIAVLGQRIGTHAEVPDADVARVVARRPEGAGQGRNITKRLVLVADHAVLPAVPTGQQDRPERRTQRVVGEHVVADHALGRHPVEVGRSHHRIAVCADRAVALLIREHEKHVHGSVPRSRRGMSNPSIATTGVFRLTAAPPGASIHNADKKKPTCRRTQTRWTNPERINSPARL